MWPPQRVKRTFVPSFPRASPTSWPPVGMSPPSAEAGDIGMGIRPSERRSTLRGGGGLPRRRPLLVAQRATEHLPDLALGELPSELDLPRNAEGGQAFAAERDDLLVRRRRA